MISGTKARNLIILLVIVFGLVGFFIFISGESKKGAEKIRIEGNQVSMVLNGREIIAEIEERSEESFFVDTGLMVSKNTAELFVIQMDKFKELEKRYPELLVCNSFDNIEGYKSNLTSVGLIATSKNAEIQIEIATNLREGVIKVTGSKLKMPGQREIPVSGLENIIGRRPGVYYLVDGVEIIGRKYNKNKNY